jgi:ParB-like partition proteins
VLGRGLADLIPVGGKNSGGDDPASRLTPSDEVPIATLHRNPRQPRTRFNPEALSELADSIRANGILQPILVRPRANGGYEIVAGERRYRAALQAGLTSVPVIVRSLSDDETLALALIENLIREDIGPLETARAFRRLMDDFGWTQEEMGRRVGKSRVAVTNSLRLLHLPEPIQKSLEAGEITEGHARALLGDEKTRTTPEFRERQMAVWRQAAEKKLSVRDVERMMRPPAPAAESAAGSGGATARSGAAAARASGDAARVQGAEMRALEDLLRTALGTKVALSGDLERGRIEIEYFSDEELDGLISRLTGRSPEPEPAPATPASPPPASSPAPASGSRRRESPILGLLTNRLPST